MFRWKLMLHTALPLAALLATNAGAAVPLKILGFDDMSCRAWSASKDDVEQRALYVAWVRGVLSGHNYANPEPAGFGDFEWNGRTACKPLLRRTKPLGQFSDAAFRLSDQFSGRNARDHQVENDKLVRLCGGNHPLAETRNWRA
jgi:hypothetical protein